MVNCPVKKTSGDQDTADQDDARLNPDVQKIIIVDVLELQMPLHVADHGPTQRVEIVVVARSLNEVQYLSRCPVRIH